MTFLKNLLAGLFSFFANLFSKKPLAAPEPTKLPGKQSIEIIPAPMDATAPPKVWEAEEIRRVSLETARRYIGVVEVGGDNKGPEVELFQKAVDGKAAGEPWCAAFVQFVVLATEKRVGKASGLFASEHVRTIWNHTPESMRVDEPQPGDLMVWGERDTTNGHIGIIEALLDTSTVQTIEGNTTPDQQFVNREGNGVYRKRRKLQGGQKLQVLGFIRLWNSK